VDGAGGAQGLAVSDRRRPQGQENRRHQRHRPVPVHPAQPATGRPEKDDVELVHLQHPDGRTALEKGDVDAWAGLDPHMAASQVQAGSRLLYRNRDFNSYGVVSVTEQYAKEHPQTIDTVIKAYEQAREWSVKNPDELAKLLASESGLPLDVARLQLSRTDLSSPQLTAADVLASKAAAPILVSEELVRRGVNVDQVIDQLIDTGFQQVAAQ